MDVTIVTVNYNTPHHLLRQLTQLGTDVPHIVVDNASQKAPDVSAFANVQQINAPHNKGYAGGCNLGLLHTHTKWVLFLNPDVHMTKESVRTMITTAEACGYDACSPEPPKAGYKMPLPSTMSLLAEFTPLRHILRLPTHGYMSLFGGAVLVRREVLMHLGGWDERYFVWYEDADLTSTLLDHGYTIGWVNTPLEHDGGASFNTLSATYTRPLFFTSMHIYAREHFSTLGVRITHAATARYMRQALAPARPHSKGISLIIPNVHARLLTAFLERNKMILLTLDEVIIVSSALHHNELLWELRAKYPHIIFIPIANNRGFAHTVNIGFRRSTQKYVATANDDTTLSHDFFAAARTYCEAHSDCASVNPVIIHEDGIIESAGITILPQGKAVPHTQVSPEHSKHYPTQATNAACVIYRRSALADVGVFDERFGSYLEDIDLSLRLSRAGYYHCVLTEHTIVHTKHATSRSLGWYKQWLDMKNWVFVIAKNWPWETLFLHFPAIAMERTRNAAGIIKSIINS